MVCMVAAVIVLLPVFVWVEGLAVDRWSKCRCLPLPGHLDFSICLWGGDGRGSDVVLAIAACQRTALERINRQLPIDRVGACDGSGIAVVAPTAR